MLRSRAKYYYSRLDAPRQKIYRDIMLQIERLVARPQFETGKICVEDIQQILQYIHLDNPGLFYLPLKSKILIRSSGQAALELDYLYTPERIHQLDAALDSAVATILSREAIGNLDDYHKELAIHDYLAGSITYDHTPDDTYAAYSIIGALLRKQAVCDGYAKAFKLLSDRAGLATILVHGDADNEDIATDTGHAWNIIRLEGRYAHVDVTWDSTAKSDGGISHAHFNLTDEQMRKDHAWNFDFIPTCDADELNYYSRIGTSIVSKTQYRDFIADQLAHGRTQFSVRIVGKGKTLGTVSRVTREIMDSLYPRGGYSYSMSFDPRRSVVAIAMNKERTCRL